MKRKYNLIKEVLSKQNRTQVWLAEKLGKDETLISRYANNQRQPSIATLFEIAYVLKIEARSLLARMKDIDDPEGKES